MGSVAASTRSSIIEAKFRQHSTGMAGTAALFIPSGSAFF
jgi:hypothetical protein